MRIVAIASLTTLLPRHCAKGALQGGQMCEETVANGMKRMISPAVRNMG